MSGAFDVVVCGGGTAGAVVAARLVEAGRRVLLLEAGPDYGAFESGRWPAELLDSATIPTSHDWELRSEDGRRLAFERAKVIGGCSAHNGCTVSWGHRADYDGWGLPGWFAAELLPLFEEASERMRVRRFADDELTPFHRGFIEAGIALGLPEVDDLDTLDGERGTGTEPSNSPGGVRWNAAFAYLDPVRGRPGLEIHSGVLVERVVVESGRAVGVRAIGSKGAFQVRADQVVLTAGTYGTPAITLRSGIGPADELRALGVEVVAGNPGIGANLHDHPAFELFYPGTEELARRTAAIAADGHPVPDEQGFAKEASSLCEKAPFDLHVFPEISLDRRPAIFVACVTPRSRGRVTLRSADPFDAPRLDHGYLTDPEDHDFAALADGVELARAIAAQPGFADLLGAESEPGLDAEVTAAIRSAVIHYWHPVGSCAMGIACDERGRIYGVGGLVAADASVFPQTPRATTNIPTVVAASRIADWLAE